jgi:hypothetical protein
VTPNEDTAFLKPPPLFDAGRSMQLALNGLAGNEQVPAATRRGKNDTLDISTTLPLVRQAPQRAYAGTLRSLCMCLWIQVATIRPKIGLIWADERGKQRRASGDDAFTWVEADNCVRARLGGRRRRVCASGCPGIDPCEDDAPFGATVTSGS